MEDVSIIKGKKMAEESKKLQVTFSGEMIKLMEDYAKSLGMTLNQYIIYCVSLDIDKRVSK
ncbi:hypothetical protein [Aliarcobacter cryaerophilus]|uniref:hypothetical protein n=1 Tax=Aliarcobacter cryaerophilus TaxID=28198 RepID=UPI0021B679E9|nr:hypothetical protein [Aliarcobacter cryaerophilus]MCT7405635.1 hypothetical protein [Aliarcobacter cryaerophilus]MCT7503422.1 hypothetical protein [Aliarcobacter cryaerophilus]